jgi:hypothetical protein
LLDCTVTVELVEQLVGTWATGGEPEPDAPAPVALAKVNPAAVMAMAKALPVRRSGFRHPAMSSSSRTHVWAIP